jgi:ankyrin repeat protein
MNHLNSIRIRYDELRWPWLLPCGPTIQQLQLTTATSLHIAAALGRVEIARSLIARGASVHAIDAHSWTPLHHAASQGQTQMVETLLYSGANPNAVDLTLRTSSMWAASRGFLAIMTILMKGGTDLTVKDRIGRTTLQWATASGAWDIAILLINSSRCGELKTISIDGDSVLSPSLSTSPSFRTFLLNLAPDPSFYEPRQCNILSTIVVSKNRSYLRKFLRRLPKTLLPSLLTHRALNMGTPLYAAATHAAEEVIDILLDAGADLEHDGGEYGTPLMGACAAGRLIAVRMLVLRGARTSYVKDDRIISVMEAARLHPMVIRWLLVERFTGTPRLIMNVKH